MTHVIALTRVKGYENAARRLAELTGEEFVLIAGRSEMTRERLEKLKPRYVFFPHWSEVLTADIYENFECVMFHMTDLPFGRGGSPLQNLILRGFDETKISAFRCEADLDGGPVYLKLPLGLEGGAEEIYRRAAALIVEKMIPEIVRTNPRPVPQTGEAVMFRRRRPEESDVASVRDARELYDRIRMVDAEGYPKAFLETPGFRLEFEAAEFKDGETVARVRFRAKEPER